MERQEDKAFELIEVTVAQWVATKKELKGMTSTNIMHNWDTTMREGRTRKQRKICWHV